MKAIALFFAAGALSLSALAKLPAPSDEAKAKAAEAAAKAAHAGKVDAYQLCKAQNRVAAQYRSKSAKPVETPPCADPGPFVYKPAAPAAAAPAAAPAAEKKKNKKS